MLRIRPLWFLLAAFAIAVCDVAGQSWTQLAPLGPLPSGRDLHSAVYNPSSNRMIVFGGRSSACGLFNDTWVLANANGTGGAPAWTQLTPLGGPPGARHGHTAVYSPATNRMIVFGGDANAECVYAPPNNFNDVWILSNADGTGGAPEWARLSPTGPAPTPRTYHSAVYDETSNRLIIFGGNPGPGFCSIGMNDAWVLTNANGLGGTPAWTPLAPTGTLPPGRDAHSAVYDAGSNRMIVFGGQRPCGTFSDVWMLAGANGAAGTPAWTQLTPTGTVAALMYHTAIYAEAPNRMVVFGAVAPGLYSLDRANALGGQPAWSDIPVAGPAPALRALHSAVYDPRSGGMIIFGGDAAGRTNDTWVLADAAGPQINTPPVIACPANITTMVTLSAPGAVIEYAAPLASDDSGVVTTICTPTSGSMFAPGVTTVTCAATDPLGDTSSCSFLVTIDTPQSAARRLINSVTQSAFGTPGDAQSLVAKIEAAIQQLDRGNAGAARNQLQAFINQVNALVKSGRLAATRAGEWTSAASTIIEHAG